MSAASLREHPPIGWQRALSVKPGLTDTEERLVRVWLRHHGWSRVATATAEVWLGPIDGDGCPLARALRTQAARCAQAVLEPRGWSARAAGKWLWNERLRRDSARASVVEALQAEQLAHQAVS